MKSIGVVSLVLIPVGFQLGWIGGGDRGGIGMCQLVDELAIDNRLINVVNEAIESGQSGGPALCDINFIPSINYFLLVDSS